VDVVADDYGGIEDLAATEPPGRVGPLKEPISRPIGSLEVNVVVVVVVAEVMEPIDDVENVKEQQLVHALH
jgi:hypothetical protein